MWCGALPPDSDPFFCLPVPSVFPLHPISWICISVSGLAGAHSGTEPGPWDGEVPTAAPVLLIHISSMPHTASFVYLLASLIQLWEPSRPPLFIFASPATEQCPACSGCWINKWVNVQHEVNFHTSRELAHSGRHSSEHKPRLRFLCPVAFSPEIGPGLWGLAEWLVPPLAAQTWICTQIRITVLFSSLLLPQPILAPWPKPTGPGPANSSPWRGAEWQADLF